MIWLAQLKSLPLFKTVQLDTSDEQSILNAAKELEGVPIDLLINNAGVFVVHDFATTTKEDLMKHFEVNTVGTFLVTRAFLPNLKLAAAQNDSAIVASILTLLASNVSKDLKPDIYGGGSFYGYRSSKAALNRLNNSLAIDLASDKIIAVVVHPGHVATDMTGGVGVIQPKESVEGMIKAIGNVTFNDSGKFIDYEGGIVPW